MLSPRLLSQRGSATIEISLLAPWLLFLFVGMFDMGIYTYTMIGVENAARVAAEYTSQNPNVASDSAGACTRALAEMAMLPNVGSQSNCNAGGGNTVVVSATALGSSPLPASVDGQPATQVQVTYTGNQLIPIPGLLMGRLNITRSLQMRVKP
ncbi:MAG TPA: TadE/TadG family type IV pilus assembly protein [Bryobacteraceae bacterium]|nr:TadE/TadG family type IV pilus assembly protein [Bryobacteraceae bacterium]